MKLYRTIFLIFCILLLFFTIEIEAVLLVDFGSSPDSNVYGLEGWNTVIKSPYNEYSNEGPGGLRLISNFEEYTDYQGIQGSNRNFQVGERIVITWYNIADHGINFIPRISFSDPDFPGSGEYGTWFTMRSYDNYRQAMIYIAPNSVAKSVFNITDSGVNAVAGNASLVNINLHIEWGQSEEKQYLICDKIELLFDADITPPDAPSGLNAQALSDSEIFITWNIPYDDNGVYEYFIYNEGEIEGHSLTNSFTASLLEPSTQYSFTVIAVDEAQNKSNHSGVIMAETLPFQYSGSLIGHSDLEYLGAFRLPPSDIYAYGGDGLAYFSEGDKGKEGLFSGSLFISNLNQHEHGYVCEISIPEPIISLDNNINDLNTAIVLQNLTNIRPPEIDDWDWVDNWKIGLDIVSPRSSLSTYRLYSSWGFHYQLDMTGKTASIGWCDPEDLSSNIHEYAHYVGNAGGSPYNPQLNNYLFSTDHDYALLYFDSRSLITGRYRDGGLSGLGPTLYAFAPWEYGSDPPNNTEFSYLTLLEYGSVYNSDQYNFPDSIKYYNHADEWAGGEWLMSGNKRAVALMGNNAVGDNWYGFTGENMHLSWIEWNIPQPEFLDTDPDGKGWRANNYIPMIILYNPADLKKVVQGELQSHEPQPYACIRLDRDIFYGENAFIRSAAFDDINNILYVTEGHAWEYGRIVIHAWRVQDNGDLYPPAAPSELSAKAVSSSRIDLEWIDNSDNEDGFLIERRPGQTGSWIQIADIGYNNISYSDTGLDPETVYCYRIRAYNLSGSSDWSNIDCDETFGNDITVPVYRFFNTVRGGHLYTISEHERDTVMQLPEWNYEGPKYEVHEFFAENTSPTFRFFNIITGIHLYTISEHERDAVMQLPEWNYEGIRYHVHALEQSGTIPVFRFFNHVRGGHLYTISEHERDTVMTLPEWTYEGIVFYVYPE